ncbi:MAG TPA: hypothetical protein HPQ03_00705 [Deltaproteobacteria bacterium]|nr:hypothetical protein [Deltaproteobacteria bacterium]
MSLFKHRPGAWSAVLILIALGFSGVLFRTVWSKTDGVPEGDQVWRLIFDLQFESDQKGATANIAMPADTSRARVFSQNFYHPQMHLVRSRDKKGESREAVFVAPQRGEMELRAEFQIHCSPTAHWQKETKSSDLTADVRDHYLRNEALVQAEHPQVLSIFQNLSSPAKDHGRLLETIADYCENKIAVSADSGSEDAAEALSRSRAGSLGRARAMVALVRAGKIPARLVTGFILNDKLEAFPHYWMEAYHNKRWTPFDPENGHRFDIPHHFIPVRLDGSEIIKIKGGSDLEQVYTISPMSVPRGLLGSAEKKLVEILDLTRLPIPSQSSLIIILMLPIGALITTFMRNVIGARTIGTFTPTLLALAAVYTDWRTATAIFLIVIVIGIGGRALMPGLRLLKVPRLSMVFTLVAMTMTYAISALDYINFNPSGHLILLPMVVLTTIVDRSYSVADEDGRVIALVRLGWTIVVALFCVGAFKWRFLSQLLLVYPELHFITLSIILLLGLYTSKKILDYPHLRFLTEKQANKKRKTVDSTDSASRPREDYTI